ncbi:ABC transporter permease [Nocardiopsis aegyptia]|uniref:NitT/TauT family transport system permease protein n=1 Tax=Nocardiopsis aegyptia TaxID=220378 RepID=A0A7Z0J8D7_9ACTN|nr:ABC transporter permease [Nocardiopsis aegyptia]NYJ32627.1 NitT/TauT family transport system permease protein [Nocardiopsis aegyptia]
MMTESSPDTGAPTGLSTSGPVKEARRRSWWYRNRRTTVVWSLRAGVVLVFLLLWQIAGNTAANPMFVSDPVSVWEQLSAWIVDGTLGTHTWITIQEVVLGYVIGAAAGALAGYVLASIRLVYDVFEPLMMALYSIPKVALAPLFIVWFGIGIDMKVILAAVSVFFLVFLNTAAGVRDVDRGLVDAVRLMGGSNRDIAVKVVLPASMTGLITGLKVSIPYALIGAVIGELVASNRGLGYLINDSAAQFNTAGVFAAVVVLTALAMVLNTLVGVLASRANRWKPLDAD